MYSKPDSLSARQSAIVRTLLYFDIFKYPLTLQEILRFCNTGIHTFSELQTDINWLVEHLFIYQFGDLYSTQNDSGIAVRRRAGNTMAEKVMPIAQKRARFIQQFPFVRSVLISGSLSKQYFDKNSDVDFMVITKPGRLWVCRLFLTLYKKIFLLNRRKYFCINYYIDSDSLYIPDENIFAATEIITLLPQTGFTYYNAFMQSNTWVNHFYPNHLNHIEPAITDKPKVVKRFAEWIFSGKPGNLADVAAYKLTAFFLKKKYRHIPDSQYAVSFRTNKHVSKHHPHGFQFKVMDAMQTQCKQFETQHQVSLL